MDDVPVGTSSPKESVAVVKGTDALSLFSNNDLNTDDTREEDVMDTSKKLIDLDNPSTSQEVSVSDTEYESDFRK